jgi:hypothetical protein
VAINQYPYSTNENFLEYEFFSEGPRGKIKKLVQYEMMSYEHNRWYNLAFGDWNEDRGLLDDLAVSRNEDAERVLATVASTVLDFTNRHPGSIILLDGSTPSRTRRYQMSINKYWAEIDSLFQVFGLVESKGFIPFSSGVNYQAFAVIRKKH